MAGLFSKFGGARDHTGRSETPPSPPLAGANQAGPPRPPSATRPTVPADKDARADLGPSAAGTVERTMRALGEVERLRAAVDSGTGDLWAVHPVQRDPALDHALHAPGATPIIALASLKGGAGKTTIAANMAACLAGAGQRVLLVDLGTQAALTRLMVRACALERMPAPLAEHVMTGAATAEIVASELVSLDAALPGCRLLAAGPALAGTEQMALVRWLLDPQAASDLRFRLARVLAAPALRNAFDVILIDTPSTVSAATVNAFAASTHVVVPAIFDGLSLAPVHHMLTLIRPWVQQELNPNLTVAGVVGTKTSALLVSPSEAKIASEIDRSAEHVFGVRGLVCAGNVPQRGVIAKLAGQAIAYQADTGRNSVEDVFDQLTAEHFQRIAGTRARAA